MGTSVKIKKNQLGDTFFKNNLFLLFSYLSSQCVTFKTCSSILNICLEMTFEEFLIWNNISSMEEVKAFKKKNQLFEYETKILVFFLQIINCKQLEKIFYGK